MDAAYELNQVAAKGTSGERAAVIGKRTEAKGLHREAASYKITAA